LFWFDNDPWANFNVGDASGQQSALAMRMGWALTFVVHGEDIYWIEENPLVAPQGRWLKRATATGDVTVLAEGTACLPWTTDDLVIDGMHAYWATSTCEPSGGGTWTITSIPLTGGSASTLFTTTAAIVGLGSDATSLYWEEWSPQPPSDMFVKKLAKLGGVPQTLLLFSESQSMAIGFGGGLVTMNGFVYFSDASPTNTFGYRLKQVPVNGGSATLLLDVPSGAPVFSMTVDNANLYWSDRSTVNAMSLQGGGRSTLASGQDSPMAVALDATNLYWLETLCCGGGGQPGRIKTMPKLGGTTTLVMDNLVSPWGRLAVDSGNVYWSEGGPMTGPNGVGRIARAPLTGGSDTTVASGFLTEARLFLMTDQFVYVADAGTIKKLPITGGFPERLYAGPNGANYIAALATNGSSLYFADSVSGTILRMSVNGGSITSLTGSAGMTTSLAVEGNTLYWLDGQTTIKSMPASGGPITTLFSGPNHGIFDFIADESNIFFIQGGPAFSMINQISLNGGAVTTLVPGAAILSSLDFTQDDTFVYWSNQSQVGKVSKSGGHEQYYELAVKNSKGGIAVDDTRVYWVADDVMYSALPK